MIELRSQFEAFVNQICTVKQSVHEAGPPLTRRGAFRGLITL